MKQTEYTFKTSEVESQLKTFAQKGITEFTLHDQAFSKNKAGIIKLLKAVRKDCPNLFISILVDASVIDRELVAAASEVFSSFDIPLAPAQKGGNILFDKKFYANKARLLNEAGLVFGFQLTYADCPSDTLKSFMERLDFAANQYPNHIDFPQLEVGENGDGGEPATAGAETASVGAFGGKAASQPSQAATPESGLSAPKVTGLFSAKDIRYARDLSFAVKTFYSCGRAVPWFLSILKPLKIYPSRFFADFAEWQRCNNCDYKSGFAPEKENHKSIEKMQVLFLEEKFEEKACGPMLTAATDLVKINGAFARLVGENEESKITLNYNPEDLLGPESQDLAAFSENVCMENCKIRIFFDGEEPEYELL